MDKWIGRSEEGLFQAVQGCLKEGAGLKTSEFTVDDIRIDLNEEFVLEKDADELYIHTVKI